MVFQLSSRFYGEGFDDKEVDDMLQRQSIGKIASMLVILIFLSVGCGRDQKKQAGKNESEGQAVQAQDKAIADHTEEISGRDGAPMVLIPGGDF